MSDDNNDLPDDKVGNKKPPKATQFKKGVSGNPNGRPKGSANLRTKFMKELSKTVNVIKNGKPQKMTKFDLGVKHMVDEFAKGDLKSAAFIFKQVEEYAANAADGVEATPAPTPDKDALAFIVKRLQRRLKEQGNDPASP